MPRLTTASMDSGELRIWTALNSPESSPPIAGELFATEANVNEDFSPSPAPSPHLPIAGEFFAIEAAVNENFSPSRAPSPPLPIAGELVDAAVNENFSPSPAQSPPLPIAGEFFDIKAAVNENLSPSTLPSPPSPIAGEFFTIEAAVDENIFYAPAPSPIFNDPTASDPAPSAGGPLPPSPRSDGGGNGGGGGGGSSTGATVGITVGVLAFLFVAIVCAWLLKKKKPKSKLWSCFGCCQFFLSTNNSNTINLETHKTYLFPPLPLEVVSTRGETRRSSVSQHPEVSKAFTYNELKEATHGFAASNLLGEGGFGRVYEGTIAGNLVAVKQLKLGGGQGEREFRAEVEIISRVHHRHLVSLVGYCISDTHRLLVYKYVANGTLEEALHDPRKKCMDWATRINVALGTARGLAYLHEDCHPRIIHRDIKGSNILLDNQWEAQVADFGLAKLADDLQTHVTTRVMGTFGYVAPEYAMSGKLTDKSDVYSFGVVLLELITGKKPVDKTLPGADGEESLVEWARPLLTKALETENVDAVADPNLKQNYDKIEMFRMVEVAAACVRHSSHMRPKMVEALRILAAQDADLHQGILPGYSGALARADSEEHIRKFRQLMYSRSTSLSSSNYTGDSKRNSWVQLASSGDFGSSHLAPAISSKEIV